MGTETEIRTGGLLLLRRVHGYEKGIGGRDLREKQSKTEFGK